MFELEFLWSPFSGICCKKDIGRFETDLVTLTDVRQSSIRSLICPPKEAVMDGAVCSVGAPLRPPCVVHIWYGLSKVRKFWQNVDKELRLQSCVKECIV